MDKVKKIFEKLDWVSKHPMQALHDLFTDDNTLGYGVGAVVAIVTLWFYSMTSDGGIAGFSWPIAILVAIALIFFFGFIFKMIPNGDQTHHGAPESEYAKYFKWVVGIGAISMLVLAVWLHLIPTVLLLSIVFFLSVFWLINYFLGEKKPVQKKNESNPAGKKTETGLAIVLTIVALALGFYIAKPYVVPYITTLLEYVTLHVSPFIEYVTSHVTSFMEYVSSFAG